MVLVLVLLFSRMFCFFILIICTTSKWRLFFFLLGWNRWPKVNPRHNHWHIPTNRIRLHNARSNINGCTSDRLLRPLLHVQHNRHGDSSDRLWQSCGSRNQARWQAHGRRGCLSSSCAVVHFVFRATEASSYELIAQDLLTDGWFV